MYRRIFLCLTTVSLAALLASGALAKSQGQARSDQKAASSVTRSDRDWVNEVTIGGTREVRMGQLASTRATDPAVKDFARMMVDDHNKANAELAKLAAKKGIQVKIGDTKTDNDMQRLVKLMGLDFDKQYIDMMVKDHQDAVAAFAKEVNQGGDPNLKAWAAKTLPTLRSHLKQAQECQGKLAHHPK